MENRDVLLEQHVGVKREIGEKRSQLGVASINAAVLERIEVAVELVDVGNRFAGDGLTETFHQPEFGIVGYVEHLGEVELQRAGIVVVGPRIVGTGVGKNLRHIAFAARHIPDAVKYRFGDNFRTMLHL